MTNYQCCQSIDFVTDLVTSLAVRRQIFLFSDWQLFFSDVKEKLLKFQRVRSWENCFENGLLKHTSLLKSYMLAAEIGCTMDAPCDYNEAMIAFASAALALNHSMVAFKGFTLGSQNASF